MTNPSRTMVKTCINCKVDFVIPVCRDFREHCCSSKCKVEFRERRVAEERELRRRECLSCSSVFYPRKAQIDSGDGKYCSKACLVKQMIVAAHTPEANAKRVSSFMQTMQGRFPSGVNHPQWLGGYAAYAARRVASGKSAAYTRQYRAENPEMVREWTLNRRRGTEYERIEYGFYKKLFGLQKGLCVICRQSIKDGYHVDHVYPLSKGGEHHKHNIQLLCASCNVRKNAKDPVDFMQSRGYLL